MDTSKMNSSVTTINSLGFDSVWSGANFTAQRDSLNEFMGKLNQCIEDVNTFDKALVLRDEYISICNKISDLYSSMRSCDLETEEGVSAYNYYSSQVSQYEAKRRELRSEIIGLLGKFDGIDVEVASMIDLNVDGGIRILFDVPELLDIYNNHGNLSVNSTGLFALYDSYDDHGNLIQSGEDYVNEQIKNIVGQCTNGREAAVNVGLLLLQLAADKGVKLKYENEGANGGLNWGQLNFNQVTGDYNYTDASPYNSDVTYNQGYNNITQVQEGMDCCAWVSYLVNVGASDDPSSVNPQGFHWEGVPGLNSFGTPVPPSEAQAGDVFIWGNSGNPYAHTGMVVEVNEDPNNPGTGTIVVTESGGKYSWLSINEYSYTTNPDGSINMGSHGGTVLRDYTDVYDGTQVNHDNYQGYRPDDPNNN